MRPSWTIGLLGLALAACGTASAEPDRFDLRTPGANTGQGPAATTAPAATPTATPKSRATPTPRRKPVTRVERRIIKGWADELRHGRVAAAARYFAVPSLVSNDRAGFAVLDTDSAVQEFNRTLPCGAKLVKTRRATNSFVIGVFTLTERKGGAGCGTGTGKLAAVAFLIREEHITQWVRVQPDAADPAPPPRASPSATPTVAAPESA